MPPNGIVFSLKENKITTGNETPATFFYIFVKFFSLLILIMLAPCQWGSRPDSHAYKLIFEPTCAHARWALMHHFLSVCPCRKFRLEVNSYPHYCARPKFAPVGHKRRSSFRTNAATDTTQIIVRFTGIKIFRLILISDFFPTPRTILAISVNLMRNIFEGVGLRV